MSALRDVWILRILNSLKNSAEEPPIQSQTPFSFDLDEESGLEPTFLRLRTGDLQDGGALNGAAL